MPLRDHFHSPINDVHSWDGLHGGWPMVMVQQLIKILPEPYFAQPTVRLGTLFEVDIATFREQGSDWDVVDEPVETLAKNGSAEGSAMAVMAPPLPTATLEPHLPEQDVYEVRIYDERRRRKLVAAVEIVSPSNKDRSEHRTTFVAKVANLLRQGICVSIVDLVTTVNANLYGELMTFIDSVDPALGTEPSPIYATTIRTRYEGTRQLLDSWYHPMSLGQPLPTLPIWLTEKWAIPLELEATYEETCRTLRIR